jgi:hypothetical protein
MDSPGHPTRCAIQPTTHASAQGWTSLSEDFDEVVEATNQYHTGAHASFVADGDTALSISWSTGVSANAGVIFAAWGP